MWYGWPSEKCFTLPLYIKFSHALGSLFFFSLSLLFFLIDKRMDWLNVADAHLGDRARETERQRGRVSNILIGLLFKLLKLFRTKRSKRAFHFISFRLICVFGAMPPTKVATDVTSERASASYTKRVILVSLLIFFFFFHFVWKW